MEWQDKLAKHLSSALKDLQSWNNVSSSRFGAPAPPDFPMSSISVRRFSDPQLPDDDLYNVSRSPGKSALARLQALKPPLRRSQQRGR